MKQPVKDLADVLSLLHEDMQLLRETVQSQHAEICSLNRNIEKLRKENKELKQRLAKHEDPNKNSSNSSTPPSKESLKDEIVRRTSSLRKKSGKSVGGQPGHKGTVRGLVENPDEIIDEQASFCTECGESLKDAQKVLDYTTQIISLPDIKPLIREIRHYVMVCPKCGKRVRSYERKRGGNPVVFDASVRTMVVYLNVVQCIPFERLQSMMKTLFGIEMSQGTIANILKEAGKKAQPAIDLIKKYISSSSIVGFDESGCFCNKRLDWSWIAQTVYYTLVFRADGRRAAILENMFGDSLKNMIAVTDRHSAYFAINFLSHQVCLAHLLREIQYLNELDKNQKWSKDLENLLQEAIHYRNEHPTEIVDTKSWLDRLDSILQQNVEHLEKGFGTLKNGLIKCRDYIFKFLENPAVPSHNNDSERGIRKIKIKQKISGCFRSDEGADAFMALHSVVDTAWKNNQSKYEALLAILKWQA